MVRLNTSFTILATIVIALVATLVSANVTLNKPKNALIGSESTVTWKVKEGAGKVGILHLFNSDIGTSFILSDNVDVASGKFKWTPTFDIGFYYYELQDGLNTYKSDVFELSYPLPPHYIPFRRSYRRRRN